ncbi:hypothetical protein QVD17_04639 [Tagetes erecta]|uniref:Uncharacterized protein n=1 Tax=Tagetes erecta TaxID=13708 RepID=A0AAD8P9X6_TARER|nr:hypothetical protein QVD17_04639 [Tagetes erecta]
MEPDQVSNESDDASDESECSSEMPSEEEPSVRNNKRKLVGEDEFKQILDTMSEGLRQLNEIQSARLELEKQSLKTSQMKLLFTNISHLTGRHREIAEKVHKEIREKYGL